MLSTIVFVTMFGAILGSPKAYTEYTLDELNAMSLWGRIKLQNWRLELITLGFIGGFVLLFSLGDYYNKSLVTKFLQGISPVLKSNFHQVGTSEDKLFIKDSSENYSSYATGRDNISRIRIDFKLRPRHNLFVWIMEGVASFFTEAVQKPIDKVDVVIYPSFAYDNFITAIVSKIGMNDYRKFNYFLSLTKTSDSTNLPESFVFMSEANEFQEKLLTPKLKDSLDIQAANYIRYIAFTDQATEKPETPEQFSPFRRVVISLTIPRGQQQFQQVSNTLEAVFEIFDALADKSISFKPESLKKIVKARELELAKVLKAAEAEKLEAEAEEKARLKREERERIRNLSPDQQAKLEKKEQEKRQKKLQKKQKIRM